MLYSYKGFCSNNDSLSIHKPLSGVIMNIGGGFAECNNSPLNNWVHKIGYHSGS